MGSGSKKTHEAFAISPAPVVLDDEPAAGPTAVGGTVSDAAADAAASASACAAPCARRATSTPVKVSPAPVVSTAVTAAAGTGVQPLP